MDAETESVRKKAAENAEWLAQACLEYHAKPDSGGSDILSGYIASVERTAVLDQFPDDDWWTIPSSIAELLDWEFKADSATLEILRSFKDDDTVRRTARDQRTTLELPDSQAKARALRLTYELLQVEWRALMWRSDADLDESIGLFKAAAARLFLKARLVDYLDRDHSESIFAPAFAEQGLEWGPRDWASLLNSVLPEAGFRRRGKFRPKRGEALWLPFMFDKHLDRYWEREGREQRDQSSRRTDTAVAPFSKDLGIDRQAKTAAALLSRGSELTELGRHVEAIEVYDEVIDRHGDDLSPKVQSAVAVALFSKAATLSELDRNVEAIEVYDEVIARHGLDPKPELRFGVASALYHKGLMLGTLGQYGDEIVAYNHVIDRFGDDPNRKVQDLVAAALYYKGRGLGELERYEDEIAVYSEIVDRFGDDPNPELRSRVARALLDKATVLGQLEQYADEIAVLNDVVDRFGEDTHPEVHDVVEASRGMLEASNADRVAQAKVDFGDPSSVAKRRDSGSSYDVGHQLGT